MKWDEEAIKDSIVQRKYHLFPFHIVFVSRFYVLSHPPGCIAIYHYSLCFHVIKMSFIIFDLNHLTYRNTPPKHYGSILLCINKSERWHNHNLFIYRFSSHRKHSARPEWERVWESNQIPAATTIRRFLVKVIELQPNKEVEKEKEKNCAINHVWITNKRKK